MEQSEAKKDPDKQYGTVANVCNETKQKRVSSIWKMKFFIRIVF